MSDGTHSTFCRICEALCGLQVTVEATFEVEGASKPSCVAELLFRYYGA